RRAGRHVLDQRLQDHQRGLALRRLRRERLRPLLRPGGAARLHAGQERVGGNGGGAGRPVRLRRLTRSHDFGPAELSPTSSIQSTPNAPTPTSGNPQQSSARTSDHPTPTSATSIKAGGNKKKKATERDDDESEGKQPKRLKITYARGGTGGD
ncbi:MAG: hypothetical protein Q9213_007858, partial [Squamulea squamosa]